MNKLALFLICLFCLSQSSLAQQNLFQRSYDEVGLGGYDLVETSEGNIVMVGFTPFNKGGFFMTVTSVDSLGNFQWHERFGGNFNNSVRGIVETSDNNLVIAGTITQDPQGNEVKVAIIKLSKAGELIWERQLGENELYGIWDIAEVELGNFLVVGNYYNGNSPSPYVLKVDSTGIPLWEIKSSTPDSDNYQHALFAEDGNYLAVGVWVDTTYGINRQILTTKLSPQGDTLWTKSYGRAFSEFSEGVTLSENGDLLISGTSNTADINISDCSIMNISYLGDSLWHSIHSDIQTSCENYAGIAEMPDGKLKTMTRATDNQIQKKAIHLSTYSHTGELESQVSLGLPIEDFSLYTFKKLRDNNLVICGQTTGIDSCQGACLFLFKMTPEGDFISSTTIPLAPSIDLDLFPNPAQELVNYSMSPSSDRLSAIRMYDISGRLLHTWRSISQSDQLDVSAYAKGIYVLEFLTTAGNSSSKKLVIQ